MKYIILAAVCGFLAICSRELYDHMPSFIIGYASGGITQAIAIVIFNKLERFE